MNIVSESKVYQYTGNIRDCSLVKEYMVKILGENRTNTLIWALAQFDYFVISSDDLNRGKYILVDRGNLGYMEDDFFDTIEDLRDDTVNAINYYIYQKYMDKNRGLEMIEGII